MRRLIPDFIINRHLQKQYSGTMQANILNVDIKGITALTQALMSQSHAGVEPLTDTVNSLFTPAIEAIESRGGFVSGFAGDAFTAVFPLVQESDFASLVYDPDAAILTAALSIRDSVIAQGGQVTEFGEFELEVRIGAASGEINWRIIDTGSQAVYWFYGPGLENAVRAQGLAQTNEVIVDKQLCEKPGLTFGKCLESVSGFCLLSEVQCPAEAVHNEPSAIPQTAFIPESVLSLSSEGEFRILLSCFINLANPQDDQISALIHSATQLGGYLSHIDFTDKGWVAYVMFGAPLGYEKMAQRAMDFAGTAQTLFGKNARLGLTQGKAFTGFIGSQSRAEYTGMGMAVNLAARFMTKAGWGDVWFDESIRTELASTITAENLGELEFKGYPTAITTYRNLNKMQNKAEVSFRSGFVGREAELNALQTSCQALLNGHFAGVCYIYGDAGQGKSRLVYELERILGEEVQCFELQTDSIHRSPLNPFSYWLRQQFTNNQIIDLDTRRDQFRKNWQDFLNRIRALPDTSRMQVELERVESILAGLIGLDWEGSIYASLDSKYRPTATGFALRTLLEALCLIKPVLMIIEDLHWLDKESEEVISILTRRAGNIPFKLILTARPHDDGRLPVLNLDHDIAVETIDLSGLTLEQVKSLINGMLLPATQDQEPAQPSTNLVDYVHTIAQGNPFIVEQLTRYLMEADQLVVKDGCYHLNTRTADLPSGVQAILVARLDRLEAELKHTVQTASVLGREFAVDILSEMLEVLENRSDYLNDLVVRSQLYAGEREHIWNSLNEIKYIFSHSLLREAAYAMQLKKQIMQIHLLAAQVMEKHYAQDKTKLSEIATHYHNAGERNKAVQYYDLCAINELQSGNFMDAIKWAHKSLEIEPGNHTALVQLIKGLDAADLRSDARQLATQRLDELEKASQGNSPEAYEMLRLVVLTLNSEFDGQELEPWIMRLWERTKEQYSEYSPQMLFVYKNLGSLYMDKQQYEKSEKYYLKAMEVRQHCTGGDLRDSTHVYNDLGLLYMQLGRNDEALSLLEKAIKTHDDEYGEGHPGSIYSLINRACAISRSGDYEQAITHYLKAKEHILKRVGKDHDMYFKVMQHLGSVYTLMERYPEAEQCLRENLELQIARKNDCTFEVAVLTRGLAGVLGRTHRLEEALPYARRSLEIFKQVAAPESMQAIVGRNVLIKINIALGNLDEALGELLEAIAIQSGLEGDPQELLETFQDTALEIYQKQERWSEAENFLASVLDHYQHSSPGNPLCAKYQEKLAEVRKILGH